MDRSWTRDPAESLVEWYRTHKKCPDWFGAIVMVQGKPAVRKRCETHKTEAAFGQDGTRADKEKSMLNVEDIAAIVHSANAIYCRVAMNDWSQPNWELAPQWQRDSAIAGVKAVIDGTTKTPEEQHQAWTDLKVAEGWTYGEVKDPEAKTHPCLVPYAELPDEQKRKDHLFRAIVLALTEPV